jgi:hypothetical protein
MLSDSTMEYGEQLTTALLGLDALYAAEQGHVEGDDNHIERLVVLNMSKSHKPAPFGGYADAIDRFQTLQAEAAGLPEPDRQVYYRETCGSAIAFATWRSSGLDFKDQLSRFLHIPAEPAGNEELNVLRDLLTQELTALGYSGDLETMVGVWQDTHRVAPEDVEAVLTELLDEAWDLTEQHMEIPADKSDGMKVETVSNVPYNAMCDYRRRLIRLNIDPVLTKPGLRHLAVHEGYPGHYVQFKRREVAYANGEGPADNLLSVVNTASSSPFEGIADAGMDIIGWQDDADDRVLGLLTRYNSGIGTRAAWHLHADGWSTEAVREELLRDSLSGGEGWVDSRVGFISRHDRAALIWSYWKGDPGVRLVWNRVKGIPAEETRYFDWIYTRMHSLQSIQLLGA